MGQTTECWQLKKAHTQKMMVTEMKMISWTCGHTIRDKIKNEVIHNKLGETRIEDKMRESRSR